MTNYDELKRAAEAASKYLSDSDVQKNYRAFAYTRAILALLAERDELLAAAENLVRVKGRHHTEQAYKALEAAIAKVKP